MTIIPHRLCLFFLTQITFKSICSQETSVSTDCESTAAVDISKTNKDKSLCLVCMMTFNWSVFFTNQMFLPTNTSLAFSKNTATPLCELICLHLYLSLFMPHNCSSKFNIDQFNTLQYTSEMKTFYFFEL